MAPPPSSSPFGYVVLASSANAGFSNSQRNDLLVYTSSNQSVFVGASNSSNYLWLGSNAVQVVGNLDFTGSLTKNGVPFVSGGGGIGVGSGSDIAISGGLACGSINISANVVQPPAAPVVAESVAVFVSATNTAASTGVGSNEGNGLSLELASSNMYMNLVYFNSNTSDVYEVLRVTAEGYMGIGTMTPDYPLDVAGAARVETMLYQSAQQISDRRVKNEIVSVDSAWATQVVDGLLPVTFYFNNSTVKNVGFIAQDVEAVCPDATRTVSNFVPMVGRAQIISGSTISTDLPLVVGDVFKLSNGTICTVDGVLEDLRTFVISGTDLEGFEVEISHIRVDDFKAIDTNALLATLTACVKSLLKRVDVLEASIAAS